MLIGAVCHTAGSLYTNSLKKSHTRLAQETGAVSKSHEGRLTVALAFPNTYYVGMSNLGFQIIYHLFNSADDVVCERVFLPDGKTTRHLQQSGRPLCSLESSQPLATFHIIAFSLSFENDYLNILTMLRLAHIAPLHKERTGHDPIIIGGGVAVSLNPEPLADIFDLFVIGEGEEIIKYVLDVFRTQRIGTRWPKPALEEFSRIDGIYVPAAYSVTYHDDGTIKAFRPRAGFPRTVKRQWIKDLNCFSGCSSLTTPSTEFGEMSLVELSRGCPRRCRFCAVGHVYHPYRIRTREKLLQEMLPALQRQQKIGLLGAAASDHPDLEGLIKHVADSGGDVSISSLRADALTEEIVRLLKKSGHMTFSIAPETGSERLRAAIAKDLTDDEIFTTVALLARHRIPQFKLYFLVGLPTEDEADMEAIVDLARRIRHAYFKEARGEKWLNQITLSISAFVPKPCTPFQWHPFAEMKELKKRLRIVVNGLKKEKKIVVTHDLPKWSYVQTLLSRGDRRSSIFLLKAMEAEGDWMRAFKDVAPNPDFYIYRTRSFEEILPWDFIDHGLDKKALWNEYQRALQSA